MKKGLLVLTLGLTAAALVACGGGNAGGSDNSAEIAVVTDVGLLMDGGFNQGTYEGAVAYATANGKTYKYYQPANGSDATEADRIDAMNTAIENGAKVIVAPGFMQEGALRAVAPENPNVKFIFVDGYSLGIDNVGSIAYKEHESAFLAGYAAVAEGYIKLGGTFGGGGANPACNRFAYGFAQGAQKAAAEREENVELKISFKYGGTFSASTELQTQMSSWYGSGTEVVFSCGGSMVQSVISAARETEAGKVIGVDTDQASLDPRVITSATKGLATSVVNALTKLYAGEWDTYLKDKTLVLGAAEDAVGLPTAEGSWRLNNFTVAQYQELFASVKNGTIAIDGDTPANFNDQAAWNVVDEKLTNVALFLDI